MAVALLSPCGHVELVPDVNDVAELLQGPLSTINIKSHHQSCRLYYSTRPSQLSEVNDVASAIVGQAVRGEACLVHSDQRGLLQCLAQHSKHLPPAPAAAAAPRRRQPGSLQQHIAAAHSTHQRILRSVSTGGVAAAAAVPAGDQQPCGQASPAASSPPPLPLPGRSPAAVALAAWCGDRGSPPRPRSRRMPAEAAAEARSSSPPLLAGALSTRSHVGERHQQTPVVSHQQQQQPPATAHAQACSQANTSQGVTGGSSSTATCCTPADGTQQTSSSEAAAEAQAHAGPPLPVWSDLPVEVVAAVARCCGGSVSNVLPVAASCTAWRRAVLDDDQLLSSLTFSLKGACPQQQQQLLRRAQLRRGVPQLPAILERAAKLGRNVSALVVVARVLDASGATEDAMRCWRRAAKAGHLEAQLLTGLALYRGTHGLAQDAEDAHLWLAKALKQVLLLLQEPASGAAGAAAAASSPAAAAPAVSNSSSSGPSAGGAPAANNTPHAASCVAPPCPVAGATSAVCQQQQRAEREAAALHTRVLAQAGLVLGYMLLDGDGTRADRGEAVRHFKLAAAAGCHEAQQTLGLMYNTGQF